MRLLAIVVGLTLIVSCGDYSKLDDGKPLPMEEAKVIDLLSDMHYATQASRINRLLNSDSLLQVYKAQVFAINQVSEQEYNDLIEYLNTHIQTYKGIEMKVHKHMKSIRDEKTPIPKK